MESFSRAEMWQMFDSLEQVRITSEKENAAIAAQVRLHGLQLGS